VDVDGNFDPNGENVSYGYRYLRGCCDPAKPEFEPYILDPNGSSYGFQEFAKNVPLSAWNMDVDPPQRLVVGFLENNAEGGLVDGKYWPPYYGDADNTAGDGPREWLWIYLDEYSETPNPDYQLNAIDDPMPIMYWLTVARRAEVAWESIDEFEIIPNRVNSDAVQFTFETPESIVNSDSLAATQLDRIRVVPNPYYNSSGYDVGQNDHRLRFQNLPATCTIRIFNLMGELIATIEKDDPGQSWVAWNLLTDANLPVAAGVYLYVIDAPGIGQKTGKMAVFTEQEQLNTF
jgi:hypothetical protein